MNWPLFKDRTLRGIEPLFQLKKKKLRSFSTSRLQTFLRILEIFFDNPEKEKKNQEEN